MDVCRSKFFTFKKHRRHSWKVTTFSDWRFSQWDENSSPWHKLLSADNPTMQSAKLYIYIYMQKLPTLQMTAMMQNDDDL